jgi:NitT/TauT family transport system ATP-binding protein
LPHAAMGSGYPAAPQLASAGGTEEAGVISSSPAKNAVGGRNAVIRASDVSLTIDAANGPLQICDGIELHVDAGEFVSVVGPSGAGKTMFLNAVAGLERSTSGALTVFDEPPRPGHPQVSYAFARDALLPWRTAAQNVELALESRGIDRATRRARAVAMLGRVGLADFAGAYRAQLSQGMRQRVSLARAMITNPPLLLMDEPFAALDAQTRIVMQDELLGLLREYEGTVFLVTHDLAEAILLSDRVLVFSNRPARVKQEFVIDLPRPRNAATTRTTQQFQTLFDSIWSCLAEEVTQW